MQSFRYRIKERETERLDELIITSNCIWNYALMIQRKHYEWFGKYLPLGKLQSFIAKKRNHNPHWLKLNSQSVQEILERLDTSYQRFFDGLQNRPKFKDWYQEGSFCFKQGGYVIDNDRIVVNDPTNRKTPIGVFRFLKHRAYPLDSVRTVRIKKYNNRFYVIVTCKCSPKQLARNCNDEAGIDFGLKTFITLDNEQRIECPRWLLKSYKTIKRLSQAVSRCTKGSKRRNAAVARLANAHAKVKQRRDDWQWKLCHELCKEYAVIKIEDLCLKGWQRLWGRKASDLAIGEFVRKLEHVASKYGTQIIKIDRFYASSHICHKCGCKLNRKLGLLEREWQCPHCGQIHDRDVNAAINIRDWTPSFEPEGTSGHSAKRGKTQTKKRGQRRNVNKKPCAST